MNLTILLTELRRSVRASTRRPGFVGLATLTLALGIGACAAVFALVEAIVLRPPPYPQPDRLVVLSQNYGAGNWSALSPQQYRLLGDLPGVVSVGSHFVPKDVNVAGGGEPQLVTAWPADAGLLPTLGVNLVHGRNFTAEEDRPGGAAAVVLGHAFWQRQFNGDPAVVGRTLTIDGVATPIVGVLPAAFRLQGTPDLLLPLALPATTRDNGTNLSVIARLAEGNTVAAADGALDVRLQAHAKELGFGENQRPNFAATALAANMGAAAWPILSLFFACALCVLLLVTVNLSNLMLMRAVARSHDSAVRAALGASGRQIGLPALAEGLLVGALGATAGLALAAGALRLGRAWLPPEWLPTDAALFGPSVWLFAFAAGLGVAALSAAFGAWRARGAAAVHELVAGARTGPSRGSNRLGRSLVVAQAALATVLLASAALLSHSLLKLNRVDLGFDAAGVLVFRLNPSPGLYPDAAAVEDFSRRLLDRLRAEPGVRQAALTTNLPIASQLNLPVRIGEDTEVSSMQFRAVSPAAFATFDVPLLAGRDFDDGDRAGSEPVAIVSAAFARQYFGGDALGKSLRLELGPNMPSLRIVGVTGDVRQFGPQEDVPPIVHVPLAQLSDDVLGMLRQFIPLNAAIRVDGDPAAFAERSRAALREVAPQQGLAALRLLERDVADATAGQRMNAVLIGLFAGVALLLAGVGLYSVTAVAVATRRREYGVRAALGAAPLRLMRGVVDGGLRDVGLGLVIGLAAAVGASRLLERFLFDTGPADPLALGATVAALFVAGLLATVLPALRAARQSPMQALRSE
ncbi:ADOP family duplicated permease [Dokdonella koreensis]|uniref:Permease n=1 Tax=Dokdonella koreensis DS-123 TaxID=1300342 RepID=A0A167GBH2_9GAMM|nr:ADOP family duplicated permease [Dokdonella koreensis]ANB16371.1 Permease [Dokdonella koreensis DS-123]